MTSASTRVSATVSTTTAAPDAASTRLPVLLVHGIDDDARSLAPLADGLTRAGFQDVQRVELKPNDGAAPISVLAGQVAEAAGRLRARTGRARIDVVAFSMGALVSRYYLQRLEGRNHVRRFVSISGPHAGTLTGWLRANPGARDMRPGSDLLRGLAADESPFGDVQVFTLWTPLDLMILPARSSQLAGARERTIPVILHPLMLRDGRVLRSVEEALTVERPEDFLPLPVAPPRDGWESQKAYPGRR
ncbi:esterase/lipase family protein [Archangium violaceum]|uniref:esterase/lipase family protein n=1 Tax=Archangium violaceum TaxID=83451 RepID=UPI001EF120F1|nr:alpha/beta fold hydrolase [Archangium violaceum]